MGCNDAVDDACISHEYPSHRVLLSTFEIDVLEVTQVDYAACIAAGVCNVPDDTMGCYDRWDPELLSEHPVVCIPFDDANAYCNWLDKDLPTEAQWEKAARGIEALRFPFGNDTPTCDMTNFAPNDEPCIDATQPVGSYPQNASPYGVLDMAGNVWERTLDWYQPDGYERSEPSEIDIDPKGPLEGTSRVLRGGGFTSPETFVRASSRDGARAPWITARNVGLRCVR